MVFVLFSGSGNKREGVHRAPYMCQTRVEATVWKVAEDSPPCRKFSAVCDPLNNYTGKGLRNCVVPVNVGDLRRACTSGISGLAVAKYMIKKRF